MINQQYQVVWLKPALKGLSKLPKSEKEKIIAKIENLKKDSTLVEVKKLANTKNLFRIRSGNYRVIFQIDRPNKKIKIVAAGHRKDVYRAVSTLIRILTI